MERADFQAVLDQLIRAQVTAQHAYWPRHLTPGERKVSSSEVLIGVPDGSWVSFEPRDLLARPYHPVVRALEPEDCHSPSVDWPAWRVRGRGVAR